MKMPDHWRPQYHPGERVVRWGRDYRSLSVYYEHFGDEHIKVILTRDPTDGAVEEASRFLGRGPNATTVPTLYREEYPCLFAASTKKLSGKSV